MPEEVVACRSCCLILNQPTPENCPKCNTEQQQRFIIGMPLVPKFGTFEFKEIALAETTAFANATSFIGEINAKALSRLVPFTVNASAMREFAMIPGDSALVFQLTHARFAALESEEMIQGVHYRIGVLTFLK